MAAAAPTPTVDPAAPLDPTDHAILDRLAANKTSATLLAPMAPEDHAALAKIGVPLPAQVDALSPLDREDHEILGRLHRSDTPRPIAAPVQSPASAAQSPVQGPGAPGAPIRPGSQAGMLGGHVVDPVTGTPMVRGQAHAGPDPLQTAFQTAGQFVENVKQNPVAKAVGAGLEPIFRVLSVFANPYHAVMQKGWEGASKASMTPGATPFLSAAEGFVKGALSPEAAVAAGRSFINPHEITLETPQALPFLHDQPVLGFAPGTWQHEVLVGAFGFGVNILGDEVTGRLQGPVVNRLLRAASKIAEARGLHDVRIPGLGKSLNDLREISKTDRILDQHFAKAEAAQGPIRETAIKTVRDAQESDRALRKLLPSKAVDAVDRFVFHWIEAGSEGAKYADRATVEKEAGLLAADPKVRQRLIETVRNRGSAYSKSWQEIGHKLEEIGYLQPGTVEKMGGSYAARMYESTSHNPGDIMAWLHAADEINAVHPGAIRNAEQILGRAGRQGGAANAGKARTLTTWEDRQAHGAVEQASPVFAKSIAGQSRIAAKGEALRSIAKDPRLARTDADILAANGQIIAGNTKVVAPPGTIRLKDQKYGPLNDMIVPVHVKDAIDAYVNTAPVEKGFAAFVSRLAGFYKSQAMFLNFPSLLHKVKYDSVLAEGRAADEGLRFMKTDVLRGARELIAYRHTGQASKAVAALRDNTRAFVPGMGDLGEMGGSLLNTLGDVGKKGIREPTWWRKLRLAVPHGIGSIEQTYKVALTEKLAGKLGYEEAARVAQETIGDWSNTNPTIRFLEKYGGVPFLTARAKALPKMLGTAIRHPQILQRAGHLRVGPSIAAAMPPDVQLREQIADPGAIPLPGVQDDQGRPRFITHDPLKVDPLQDIVGLGGGVGGALGLAAAALENVDAQRSFNTQQAQSIVKPGEIPPLDAIEARMRYVGEHMGPSVFRSGERLTRAAQGKTKFGGPYAEPEPFSDAMLGVATGVRLGTPETEIEKKERAGRVNPQTQRALQYFTGYWNELQSGKTPTRSFPLTERIKTTTEARTAFRNARDHMRSIIQGKQFKGDEQIQEIRKQSEWLVTLMRHFDDLAHQELSMREQLHPGRR